MSKLLCLLTLAIVGPLLVGCSTTTRTVGVDQIQYKETPTSTFAWANKLPATLPAGADQSERARLLYGFPSVDYYVMGSFDILMFESVGEAIADGYRNKGTGSSAGGTFSKDDGIAIGASVGGAAGGALALASAFSGSAIDSDMRQGASSALCFVPTAETSVPQVAVDKCGQIVVEHLKSALVSAKVENAPAFGFIVSGAIPSDANKVTNIGVFKNEAKYAKGFAPAELGGYEAHLVYVQMRNAPPVAASAPTIEEVVAALKPGKPSNVAYMFSAGQDARNRKGLEPLGLF